MDPKNNFGLYKLSPPASRKSARNVVSKKSSYLSTEKEVQIKSVNDIKEQCRNLLANNHTQKQLSQIKSKIDNNDLKEV